MNTIGKSEYARCLSLKINIRRLLTLDPIWEIRFFTPVSDQHYPLSVNTIGLSEHRQRYVPGGYAADQLFFCYSGRGVYRFPDHAKHCVLGSNQWLIVPKHTTYEYESDTSVGTVWNLGYLALKGSRLDELFRHFHLPNFSVMTMTHHLKIWDLLEQLWELAGVNRPNLQREAAHKVYTLLTELQAQHASAGIAPPYHEKRSDWAVKEAMSMMKEHYAEQLLISQLAKTLGFSQQHLNRQFKAETGKSMYAYLQTVRLEKSIALLQQTRHPLHIRQIASQIGMDTSNFIRLFARQYGIPPAGWREHKNRQP